MYVALALATRRARLQQLALAIDAAATPGRCLLYAGAIPQPGQPPAGELQCAITLAQPCAQLHASDALLVFTAGVEGLRTDDETITFARFVDGDGTFVFDADVSLVGGDGAVQISNVNGVVGAFVRIESGVIGE
ncbi:MAG: hypothetical protein ACK4ZD_06195 [Caldimonas sp.]|uniref:hypothetical protein n=1 Tax=Caldimonas sp. TaxID=2838790 RepID=UPI00391CB293